MKKIKQINNQGYSIILYEMNNQYVVLRSGKGEEIPSMPSSDLNMALSIFELWHNELIKEDYGNFN